MIALFVIATLSLMVFALIMENIRLRDRIRDRDEMYVRRMKDRLRFVPPPTHSENVRLVRRAYDWEKN